MPSEVNLNSKLSRLTKSELVLLISQYAQLNKPFKEFVQLRTATEQSNDNVAAEYKGIIDEVFGDDEIPEFLPRDHEQRFDKIVESIDLLNKSGRSEVAMNLIEYSFQYASNIGESVMEPDYFSGQLFDDLIDIHIDACSRFSVDKERIRKLISKLENEDRYGFFMNLNKRYKRVFGSVNDFVS